MTDVRDDISCSSRSDTSFSALRVSAGQISARWTESVNVRDAYLCAA